MTVYASDVISVNKAIPAHRPLSSVFIGQCAYVVVFNALQL